MNQNDALPDAVLLVIFAFYVGSDMSLSCAWRDKVEIDDWQTLVHVCRRWRRIVLGSPRGLNLQLYCSPKTPIKKTLRVWPALPLVVSGDMILSSMKNVIAALRQRSRVRQVNLRLDRRQLEEVLAMMQAPYPELTDLRLSSNDYFAEPLVIPDSFLDGSAPRLRSFTLHKFPILGLPKLLLSANHLIYLGLTDLPYSGYISPKAMTEILSVLSRLRVLCLVFRGNPYRPDRRRSLPPPKHSILSSLSEFRFIGPIKYLEELVTHIDSPQLNKMHIISFNVFDLVCPRLIQFINRTPTLRARDKVHLQFVNWMSASIALLARSSILRLEIETRRLSVPLVRGFCNSSLHPLSTVGDLYIEHQQGRKGFHIAKPQWLQVLLPFTAVKNLYLSKEFAPGIAAALQELDGSRITEVLPNLQNVFVERFEPLGPFQKKIGQFVTARQLSGHPVAISIRNELAWNEEEEEQECALPCMATCPAWA